MLSSQFSKGAMLTRRKDRRKRKGDMIRLTYLIVGYYAVTVLFTLATAGGGHGISSPTTVLFSWAFFIIKLAQGGIAPLIIYFGLLMCFAVMTHFLVRQEGRFMFFLPSGVYLWGSLWASVASRSFETEPLFPYLGLFFLSVLMVVAFCALLWRLEKRLLTHKRAAPIREQDPLT